MPFALLLASAVVACGGEPTQGIARGGQLFDTCAPCHGTDAGGNQHLGAPAIAGLPAWYVKSQLDKFQSGARGMHPADTAGIRMKSMALALDLAGDVESVAEYVASLPRVAQAATVVGNADAGRAAYAVCSACHGVQGNGTEALGAPPLAGFSDWYHAVQLEKFRDGLRGTSPQDIQGATMRPNALTLSDEAIADLVAYIQTLQ
ncbi:MAG: c-type cytochrome [Gemmatimonadota bacterium]|nr:c-type cytochrome [Gemmatimonadota bacterium]MDH5758281.1 c-type cytochrome [Gemmatimonadota bacterium]